MAARKKTTKAKPVNRHGIINRDEIFLMVTSLSNERGIKEEDIFQAIEAALGSVAQKHHSDQKKEHIHLKVSINRETGDCETNRYWTIVEDDDLEDELIEMALTAAQEIDAGLQVSDIIEQVFEDVSFTGRIAAQHARQLIMQKVREAERQSVAEQYEPRLGELLTGVVKRVTRDSVTLEFGRHIEGIILKSHLIPRENFRMNDRVRAILIEIRTEHRGPQLMLSRTDNRVIMELFKIEVPEIGEDVIEVRAAAREPGARAKIAVKTNDGRIDPIGACVGMRGARVQAVMNELEGERIDIVLWDDNPAQLVVNAMAPAEIESIVVNEDDHSMDLAVSEDGLPQAIGRGGQNIRLASELSGWKLNVMTGDEISSKESEESTNYVEGLMESLDIDQDFSEVLVAEGFQTIEAVAYAPLEEIRLIEGFDEEIAEELQQRARDVLAEKEKQLKAKLKQAPEGDNLMQVEGMTTEIAVKLVEAGILTREDLADQSVFDLTDIDIEQKLAGKLIMAARALWFEGEESQ